MGHRYIELDGLRGLAAFSVFLSHSIGLIYETEFVQFIQSSPARIIWDGAAAVNLFFVLSGFVLAKPYLLAGNSPNYVLFCVRRIFRLYPVFWLAIFLSLLLKSMYHPGGMTELSEWAKSLWTYSINVETIARHLTLLLSTNTRAIDPVVWTLIIEMRMSLIIPLIIIALNYSKVLVVDILLLAGSVFLGAVVGVFAFLPLFFIGALLAKHFISITRLINAMDKLPSIAICISGIFFYGNRWVVQGLSGYQQDLLSGVGSVMLLVCAVSFPTYSSLLSTRLARFLGETSYSFYLFHLPILLFITSHVFPATDSLILCFCLAVCVTYTVSWFTFRYIEQPGIAAGHYLARRIGWLVNSPVAK